jgi:hypothetical protein
LIIDFGISFLIYTYINIKYEMNSQSNAYIRKELGMVVNIYNPSTQEAEAGGSWVPGQLGSHSETMSLKRKEKKRKERSKFSYLSFTLNFSASGTVRNILLLFANYPVHSILL